MGPRGVHRRNSAVWQLADRQHGVVSRDQLFELGFNKDSIKHRVDKGRLHPVYHHVYALGRPQLTPRGCWLAAVLSCGPGAALSHDSAAALWGIRNERPGRPEVAVPAEASRRRPGIVVHRCQGIERTTHHGIPVTTVPCTLVYLAARLTRDQLEAAVNQADKRDLVDPEHLRDAIRGMPRRPGLKVLATTLDRRTFTLTRSQLERRFLSVARRAGFPKPRTNREVNGFEVDFFWPELKLVVETDGLRYHRTPAQQAKDRLRDQIHTAAGLTPLRFTHAQVAFEPDHVATTLQAWRSKTGADV